MTKVTKEDTNKMNGAQRLLAFGGFFAAITISAFCLSIAWVNVNEDNVKRDMMANGATPAHMYCAFNASSTSTESLIVCGGLEKLATAK